MESQDEPRQIWCVEEGQGCVLVAVEEVVGVVHDFAVAVGGGGGVALPTLSSSA